MRTRVGYTGGAHKDPTYTDMGDHTETIEIDFDPVQVGYAQLLDIFWSTHNPCSRPGGRQYMSAIFTHGETQKRLSQETLSREEAKRGKIHTQIIEATRFYLAEDYHQKYYLRHSGAIYRELAAAYPKDADFVASTAAARLNGIAGGNAWPGDLRAELGRAGLPADRVDLIARHIR